jgi:type I restriction enzyme S subunit
MTGTAGQQRVPREYFAGCALPLPPLAEQKRIVTKVDELMALCDRLSSAQQTRDNLRQKLRKSATDSLMNADDEALEKGWAIVRDNWHTLSQSPEDVGDLRRSVLQLAARGKLTVQNPEDESASQLCRKLFKRKL